jgi:hypothetical protein
MDPKSSTIVNIVGESTHCSTFSQKTLPQLENKYFQVG